MSRARFVRALAGLVLLALAVAMAACTAEREPVQRAQLLAFGTLVEVTLWGVDEARASEAMAAVTEDLAFMHSAWHPWEPGPMARTNALLETTAPFSANPSVLPLIEQAKALAAQSGGLFNPAIGRLVALWGFHGDAPAERRPPAPEAIAALVAQQPSMDDVLIEGLRVRSTNPAVQLDFGAFAKGYAVDRIVERLRGLGIQNAIVNAGGDLRAIGRAGTRPWHIGVRHPRNPQVMAALTVEGDESVFTSGDYERYFEHAGRRYHHILDPRTGYPAMGTMSVTVIHGEAAVADAAATALFVAGPRDWYPIARALGLRYVMLVDAQGTAHLSPAMQARVRFEQAPVEIVVSAPL